ncbi:MAG TPA: hypothetical protein VFB59_00850 [Candidatus Saccharimonadales bacterium]|nr:hypothetical protein [Candidatus Saccharimonadales bacterium]
MGERYTASVVGHGDNADDTSWGRTMAGIMVNKPIPGVGESIAAAVLGTQPYKGISLRHIITTEDGSSFIATAEHEEHIRTIADRLGQLANSPDLAIVMAMERPFPEQPCD